MAGPGLYRAHGADWVDHLWGFAPEERVYGPIRTATIRRGGLALAVLPLWDSWNAEEGR